MSTGRKLACKDVVGGISKVWFVDYGTLGTSTITNGVVTALSGNFIAYQYDVKSASGLEQTITSSNDNGTTFYDQSLTLVLTQMNPATQVELQKVIVSRPHVFIQDNNGNVLAMGMTRGCDTNGSISTGVALGDLNGYSLTVTGQEPLMAMFVTSTVVTAKASATQIQP
jgi:hypothetical protein